MLNRKCKKLIAVTAVIVLASSVTSIIFSSKAENAVAAEVSRNVSHTEKPSYSYIIKEYNGKLAVFETGSDVPFRITELDISTLPISDQTILNNGIEVSDSKELSRILEDYCS